MNEEKNEWKEFVSKTRYDQVERKVKRYMMQYYLSDLSCGRIPSQMKAGKREFKDEGDEK